ncbi:hypothetical protein C0W42_11295 [Photobacterium kishitanii]|uniref:hypothetical protein n=1 Tax=Photobacterium kishitanii TaxID=318456 RepID=UPI000D15111F|nr:hypothetical protein [Photobacterium kishitanii]PSU88915.1 hypothetical protein C0W42_11295 [Photobacterium kishitanii]
MSNKVDTTDTTDTTDTDNQPSAEQLLRVELFCTTRLESDKSILTLSTAGLGLIVTLLTGDNVTSVFELVVFLLSGLSFLVCSFSILRVFKKNADYIQDFNEDAAIVRELQILDIVTSYSFKAGMAFIVLAALIVSSNNLDKNMRERVKNEQSANTEQTTRAKLREEKLGRDEFNTQQTPTISAAATATATE